MWRKGSPPALLVGMEIGAATVENSVEVPQKIKNRTTILSSNSSSGYLAPTPTKEKKRKTTKNTNSNRYRHPYVHSNTIYNSQEMEATSVSTDRGMDKEDL